MGNSLKKKNGAIDIMKLIMAVVVIAAHTEPLHYVENKYILNVYFGIKDLAVPFFFIASGYFLSKKLVFPFSDKQNMKVLKSNLLRFIKLYVLWSVVYLPLDIIHSVKNGVDLLQWVKSYIQGLLFIGEHYNSWMLWYLLSTIYAILFLMLLSKINASKKGILIACVLVVAISCAFDILETNQLSGRLRIVNKILSQTCYNGRGLEGCFYIPIGILLGDKISSAKINGLIFTIGFVTNFFFNGTLGKLSIIICSLGFFGLVKNFEIEYRKIYSVFRRMSTVVYFIHMYIWTACYYFIEGEVKYGMFMFLLTTVITLIIAYLYVIIENKIKIKKTQSL